MIRVTIELESVNTGKKSILGQMSIWNRADSRSRKRGNYSVAVHRKGHVVTTHARSPTQLTREGEVLDFPKQSYNIWRLITRALLSAFPEENPQAPQATSYTTLKRINQDLQSLVVNTQNERIEEARLILDKVRTDMIGLTEEFD